MAKNTPKPLAWIRDGDCIRCTSRRPNHSGYPQARYQRKMNRIARVILIKRHLGNLPNHLITRHTCDNPWCISPAHILEGTHGDNMRDKVEHGRLKSGEALPQSKLTEAKVRLIRISSRDIESLAFKFDVSTTTIRSIRDRKTWKHI